MDIEQHPMHKQRPRIIPAKKLYITAHGIRLKKIDETFKQSFDELLDLIEDTANNGEYNCEFNNQIRDSDLNLLRSQGYKADYCISGGTKYSYYVSWNKTWTEQ
jgi:hypothetical protein